MLLTLASLKAQLVISNSADDTRLTNLITGVGVRFGVFCDRNLERAASQTEDHDAKRTISLRRFPVESALIYNDINRAFAAASLMTENTDYVLNARTGLIEFLYELVLWPQAVRVVVTGGYVSAGTSPGSGQTAIPDDITRAMLQQCEFEWKNHAEFGRTNISLQGQSVAVAPFELLPDVVQTLNAYKRISF